MFAWDHNEHYHPLLLRQLPAGASRVLDVGCGAGGLAAKLGSHVARVDAIDRAPQMIDAARAVAPPNVSCILADVMTYPLPPNRYDAVVSISALHHLPLQPALQRLADTLRPGGVLAAVALPRVDLPRELPVELASTAYHHLIGVALEGRRRRGQGGTHATRAYHAQMPIVDPTLTTREVRRLAAAVLPGVRVRRLLLWRYLLVWSKPLTA